jgi:glycosyltransferase involved in cell wall biosynthesis/2-polyprenyl-3-methyl-5-hydroxy-6-metoxy-1,4-benzoquinol methylase
MLYPGVKSFAETGCVAATEAQLCETPLIGTHIGALPETLNAAAVERGCLIDGDASSDEYQAAFVEKALSLLHRDPDGEAVLAYRDLQTAGLRWAMTYDMARVAASWEKQILGMFDSRFTARKRGVFSRLVMQDDLRAARTMQRKWFHSEDAEAELVEWEDTRNESPETYFGNAIHPSVEIISSPRCQVMGYTLTQLVDDPETWEGSILNYASGNGSIAAMILKVFPMATVLDVDYSEELLATATKFIAEDFEDGAHEGRFSAECWPEGEEHPERFGTFDLVVAGEIAEHFEYPETFLADIERYAKEPTVVVEGGETVDVPGGRVFCSVPQGAFKELMHRNSLDWSREVRGHKFSFEKRDIEALLRHLDDFDDVHIPLGETPRGTLYGHYLFHWRRDGQAIGEPDIERKICRMRPRDTVSVCIIARDNENDILRCLKSVDTLADEIWIADTGSTDATMLLAKPYTHNGGGIELIGTCPDAPPSVPPPGDFGWARNESIQHATGDWILWIDTDEMLENPAVMARYLTDNAFNGYAMRQCHVMKDAPYRFDKPIRMFRRVPRGKQAGMVYVCQGAIHEHFQPELNALIEPALMVDGGDIIHTGYINESLRREKCERRNIPHLVYDREKYPHRILGDLLEAREYCNYARWEREDAMKRGVQNPPVVEYRDLLMRGLKILSDGFMDPTGAFWEAAFDVYQDTLRLLDVGRDFLVAEIYPNGDMGGEQMRFANEEHHAIYVKDVLRRIREHGKRPPITWEPGSDPADKGATTPVVGLDRKTALPTHPDGTESVARDTGG